MAKEKKHKPILSLRTIEDAFCTAMKSVTSESGKCFFGGKPLYFSFPKDYEKQLGQNCKLQKSNKAVFLKYWIPEMLLQKVELNDDTSRYRFVNGTSKTVNTDKLLAFVDQHTLECFWVYRNYLKEALARQVKIVVCVDHSRNIYITVQRKDIFGLDVDISVGEVNRRIEEEIFEKYENTLRIFKENLLNEILQSDDYKNDNHIREIETLTAILEDSDKDVLDRIVLVSLICLFAGNNNPGLVNLFDKLGRRIYDETGKLKPYIEERTVSHEKSTKINQEIVYAAGKKWYDTVKQKRFSKLIPNQELLPLAGNLPINVHKENREDRPLMEMLSEVEGNIYLIGEGGIGKTTALYKIMQDAYNDDTSETKPIPLFIELSRARNPKQGFENNCSYFIRNSIQKQIKDGSEIQGDILEQLEAEFKKETDSPEYVLLLDGLNEVSQEAIEGHPIASLIAVEIRYILAQYTNVRVILTSRSKDKVIESRIPILYLSGINPEIVEKYLREKELSSERIESAIRNTALMEILRIPLFLILYADLKDEDILLSRGEILHMYFTQTRDNLHLERNIARNIQEEYRDDYGGEMTIPPEMLDFILNFVMPEIAWYMVKKDAFQISVEEIGNILQTVLTGKDETAWCGEYGRKLFKFGPRENTQRIARRIVDAFKMDAEEEYEIWENVSYGICDCLDKRLGILQKSDYEEYSVFHQHVRDYFAALYHINKLRLAISIFAENDEDSKEIARTCLKEWREPLPTQILTFIGEAVGEKHNVPVFNEELKKWVPTVPDTEIDPFERKLIHNSFNLYRGCFGDAGKIKVEYEVWNLFQILKLVRVDLSGEDFSNLDLIICRANDYRLSNLTSQANFDGAKVCDEFFMPMGHTGLITSAEFSPDGKYVVTASSDGTAKIWDLRTLQVIDTLEGHTRRVETVQFNREGNQIVTASWDNTAKVWQWNEERKKYLEIDTLEGHTESVESAQFNREGNRIVTASSDNTAKVWEWNEERST